MKTFCPNLNNFISDPSTQKQGILSQKKKKTNIKLYKLKTCLHLMRVFYEEKKPKNFQLTPL